MNELYLGRLGPYAGGILGALVLDGEWLMHTLERTWRENAPFVSCVPAGDYPLVYEPSAAFGRSLYELKDVPGRTECKFHAVSYVTQLEGCVGTGLDLQEDGPTFVGTSKAAELYLHEILKAEPTTLHIRWWTHDVPETN